MEGAGIVALVVLALAAAGGIGYFLWKREQARREYWAAWAHQRGWQYRYEKDHNIGHYFGFVNGLDRGRDRYGKDVLQGRWHNREAAAFTYHYETQSTDSDGNTRTHHHWFWIIALQIERSFPELRIAPEHAGKRFLHSFTGSDIDFESDAFSRAYEVKCRDKRFAYDFCNSAMIEFLMTHKGSTVELEGHWLVTYGKKKLDLEMVEPTLNYLTQMRALMPEYLFRPNLA